jgi:hypothetical protein
MTIRFQLHGMVFSEAVVDGDLSLREADDANGDDGDAISLTANTDVLKNMGAIGDSMVEFIVRRPVRVPGNSIAILDIDQIGVSAAGGGVTMMVTDESGSHSASFSGAVNVVKGLKPGGENNSPTATVASKFLSFDSGQTATLGSVFVTVDGTARHAVGGANLTPDTPDTGVSALVETGLAEADSPTADVTTVVISGDFSFASMAWLAADVAAPGDPCETAPEAGLLMTDDDADTTKLMTRTLGFLNANPNLCIMVRAVDDTEAVAIPETPPYLATKTFVSAVTGAAFPTGVVEHPLGRIMRDGTTVHLPYITQFANYNQRIVVRNRGAVADYEFTFNAEDGVTVTPGALASGELAANSTTYFGVRFGDLVTIEGSPNRATATLVVESQEGYIDVLVSQTNMNGGTDTVLYTPRSFE